LLSLLSRTALLSPEVLNLALNCLQLVCQLVGLLDILFSLQFILLVGHATHRFPVLPIEVGVLALERSDPPLDGVGVGDVCCSHG